MIIPNSWIINHYKNDVKYHMPMLHNNVALKHSWQQDDEQQERRHQNDDRGRIEMRVIR